MGTRSSHSSKRTHLSRTLHHDERELADFFENAPVGLHWVGPDGIIMRVNRAELELLGYPREEYVGRHIAEFHADPDIIEDILRRLRAGEELRNYAARMRCADGSIRHVLIDSNVKWEDGRFVHTRCFTRDITEQKRAEETVRFLSEGGAEYTCVARFDGREVILESASDGFTSVTGYTVEEFNVQAAAAAIYPDDLMRVLQDVERLMGGDVASNEIRIFRKDGEVRWLRYRAEPAWEPGDPPILSVRGAAQDITERKQEGERVYEAERRFRQLAENIDAVFWMSDPLRTQILYCSPAFEAIWGRSCESFYQQPWTWFDSVAPEDREQFVAALEKQGRGEPTDVEYRIIRPDGSVRWIRDRSFPVKELSGEVYRIAGVADDITERKRNEQTNHFLASASAALAELADYRSTLQRVASLAVPAFADWCAVDMQGPDGALQRLAVTHVDPARADLARQLFDRYPPQPSDSSGVMRVLRTGEPEWAAAISEAQLADAARDAEHLRILRDLGLKSYLCVPLRSRRRTLGVLSFAMAESGRVYDAGDLRAAEDLANRAVIAIENANLIAALQESDRRKDEFLAVLAHELRNPLAPVRNAVQILREKGPPVPELQWARDVIDRQVRQMARLVDDLLDVSRISRGKITLRKEWVDLATVIRSALETSRPLIEEAEHELSVSLPPEPVYLEADSTRLAQVLLNLLNNAARYTPPRGRIWLTAEREEEQVLIRVKDTGIGIPAEMLRGIFEMFTQVDRSMERSHGGLGIGLTLAHRLVELHGGTIEAHSEGPGKGSEFVLRLRAAGVQDRAPREAVSGRAPIGARPKRRILVADDSRDASDTLALLLRTAGHDVRTAYDGLEAIHAAAVFQPEIILLDIGMPKLNGYEAAQRIREEQGADVVLIALTGWGQETARRQSREAGFDHHLTKPVELDALEQLLAIEPRDPVRGE